MIRFNLFICAVLTILMLTCSTKEEHSPVGINPEFLNVEITPELVLTISENEDSEVLFGQIGSPVSDSKGNIFAADRQANHIIHFGPDGTILGTIGRDGEGPGEFKYVGNMFVSNDTLYAFDFRLARLTSFAPNSSRKMQMTGTLDIRLVEGRNTRGVLKSAQHYVLEGYEMSEQGIQTGFLALLNRDGTVYNAHLMPIRVRETILVPFEGAPFPMPIPAPFPRSSHYRLTDWNQFYYGWNDSLKIQVFDLDGNRVNTIRYPVAYRPANPDDINMNRYIPDHRRFVLDAMPSTKPAFDNFLVDGSGNVWVNLGDVEAPGIDRWIILDTNSTLLASFSMNRSVPFFQIQGNRLIGMDRRPDGDQRIVVYEADVKAHSEI